MSDNPETEITVEADAAPEVVAETTESDAEEITLTKEEIAWIKAQAKNPKSSADADAPASIERIARLEVPAVTPEPEALPESTPAPKARRSKSKPVKQRRRVWRLSRSE
jgi:hypothetical protein